MFKVLHEGERIGDSLLESGDPEERSVSGVFRNIGGAKALAGWMKSVGGAEDDGVVFVEMNEDYALVDADGQAVAFAEGTLIAVPAEDETFVEFSGISDDNYKTHFASHLDALSAPGSDEGSAEDT